MCVCFKVFIMEKIKYNSRESRFNCEAITNSEPVSINIEGKQPQDNLIVFSVCNVEKHADDD